MKQLFISFFVLVVIVVICLNNCGNDEFIVVEDDLISKQSQIDKSILKALDEGYTIDNPYVLVNPYFISPLTALIIFRSEIPINVQVFVNNTFYNEIMATDFVIPIVYLKENSINQIDLKVNDNTYSYEIKTEKVSDVLINVEKKNQSKYLVSSEKLKHAIIDEAGKIIWYLNLDTQGFIEKYTDDTFLIGVEESEYVKNTSVFSGIYEIDYLGKIHKRFDTKYKYHHAIKYCGNDLAYILGSMEYPMDVIYRLNLKTGAIVDYVNIIDLLEQENSQVGQYLRDLEYGIGTNSISYLGDNVLLSLRNIYTIISFNYINKKLNFVITSDKKLQKWLESYLITSKYLLLGMHDANYVKNNLISFYNNGYDWSNSYDNTFASAILVDINTGKFSKVDAARQASYAYGSFYYGENRLINYSYMDDKKGYYSNLLSITKKGRFSMQIYDNIYKAAFFDMQVTDRYQVSEYKYYSSLVKDEIPKIKEVKSIGDVIRFTKHSFELMLSQDLYNEASLILIGKEKYRIDYLKTMTYFEVPSGKYQVYLELDGLYYKIPAYLAV